MVGVFLALFGRRFGVLVGFLPSLVSVLVWRVPVIQVRPIADQKIKPDDFALKVRPIAFEVGVGCKVKVEVRERFYVEKGCFYHFMSPQPAKKRFDAPCEASMPSKSLG